MNLMQIDAAWGSWLTAEIVVILGRELGWTLDEMRQLRPVNWRGS